MPTVTEAKTHGRLDRATVKRAGRRFGGFESDASRAQIRHAILGGLGLHLLRLGA